MEFFERFDDVLARRKFSTYKKIRRFIRNNEVCINGQRVMNSGTPVNLFNDKITINGEDANLKPDLYIMMNKPPHVICTTKDKSYRTVYDLLPEEYLNPEGIGLLHTIGRLDMDTEGLLIFTTNGDFSHKVAIPEFHKEKKYFVQLEKSVTEKEKEEYTTSVETGIFCDHCNCDKSFTAKPGKLEWITDSSCYLTITEGKFHQVKRMFVSLGNQVVYLKRVQMGNLLLDENLKLGEYRFLSQDEICSIIQ